ncbi:MAG TPA: twin-arginine translocation signal domain-containing protein [Ktedonosporobacter sp.]|nr:twin-arginine translocation signal domain-containing protein [Ktedonosporobacter sp.]
MMFNNVSNSTRRTFVKGVGAAAATTLAVTAFLVGTSNPSSDTMGLEEMTRRATRGF